MQDSEKPPFRRQVFFISGYDPRGALFLHKNCVTETDKWSAASGHQVKTGPRKNVSKLVRRWMISGALPDGTAETTFDFLQWDDIIREHWERRNWLVYLQSIKGLWRLFADGVYTRSIRDSWPISIVMSAPATVALVHILGVLLPFAGPLLGLYWVRANMDRYKPEWNGRIGLFANKMVKSRDHVVGLDERLDQMADHIVASLDAERPDEALIIGHSFGTTLATIVAARVLERRPELGANGAPLTLVTLGQTQGLMSFRHKRNWYHDELARFASFPGFTWLDFSSPPDGACFALINTLDFLPDPPPDVPRRLNAQFHRIFSQERMDMARFERMQMHFFYLQANDLPQIDTDLYDFVLLIGGTEKAADRYGHRPSGRPFFKKDSVT
jgi:Lipase (class 3)